MPKGDFPHGFVLSEAARYAFLCQDVYGDILSFASAIPDHLKPLFLIPVKLETVIASDLVDRIASSRLADGMIPSGSTEESEWFGTKTFVNDDVQPTDPQTTPGSIFEIDGADEKTHHQDYNFDFNLQAPTDTSYMSDVDMTQYTDYPYRSKEKPRHSFDSRFASTVLSRMVRASRASISALMKGRRPLPPVLIHRIAIKPEALIPRVPDKIKKNAGSCSVSLTSYDKRNRVFTFSVSGSSSPRTVQAFLSNIDHVALSCDCPFWRWNGPEFHARSEKYMLGQPFGTASPPDVRDPDREYFLCKHAYAVLKRLDSFVNDIVDENWDLEDGDLMDQVDENWEQLSASEDVPLDDLEGDDVALEVDWTPVPGEDPDEDPPGEEPPSDGAADEEAEEEPPAEAPEEEPPPEEDYDEDASDSEQDGQAAETYDEPEDDSYDEPEDEEEGQGDEARDEPEGEQDK
jgi:hypothetical protein